MAIVDSYSESNFVTDTYSRVGQSFTGDGSILDSASFYLRRSGSPSGNFNLQVYSHAGTFGSSSVPGTLLATSDNIDAATISTSWGIVNFTFSGANKITLANGTKYVLVLNHTFNTYPNVIHSGYDSTSPTHDGNFSWWNGSSWNVDASRDMCFYVYGDDEDPPVDVDPPTDPPSSSKVIIRSKIGQSAASSNPNHHAVNTNYNTFQIIKTLLAEVTLAASTNNQTFSVAHGLTFAPRVRARAKQNGIDAVFSSNSENISGWNSVSQVAITTGVKFNYVTSDDTNIYLNFDNTNGTTKDLSVRLYCLEGPSLTTIPANNGSPTHKRIVVAKSGYNAETELDPRNLKFSSDYGTLKYLTKLDQTVLLDAATVPNQQAHATITHNFGYYMYVEAYVKVYIGSPAGDFEPAPFYGAGATILYDANFIVTENTIELYTAIDGVSLSLWNYDFILFLYRNNLNL